MWQNAVGSTPWRGGQSRTPARRTLRVGAPHHPSWALVLLAVAHIAHRLVAREVETEEATRSWPSVQAWLRVAPKWRSTDGRSSEPNAHRIRTDCSASGTKGRWKSALLFIPQVRTLARPRLAAGVLLTVVGTALLGCGRGEPDIALPPVEDITLSAGPDTTCVVRESGAVACWGENNDGQTEVPSGSFRSVSVGGTGRGVDGAHVCGVRRSGAIVCWGANEYGQLDAPPGRYRLVSAGGRHTCALLESRSTACWGDNARGQAEAPAGTYRSVSAGWNHTCAVGETGEVNCWGDNTYGQTDEPSGRFRSVSAGRSHTCALRVSGEIVCWGAEEPPESDSDDDDAHLPSVNPELAIAPPGRFLSVSAGASLTCAVGESGDLVCWGWANGEHPPAGKYESVSAGGVHGCAVRASGAVVCWGGIGFGFWRRDDLSGTYKSVSAASNNACAVRESGEIACWGVGRDLDKWPSPIRGRSPNWRIDPFVSVDLGRRHACALRESGDIVCLGEGNGDAPEGVYRALSAGGAHTCAVRESGEVACWGDASLGRTDAPPGTYSSVSAGRRHSCAVGESGGVVCWGDGRYGQTRAPSGSFRAVTAGWAHTCALHHSGEVTCWGVHGQRVGSFGLDAEYVFGERPAVAPEGEFVFVSAGTDHGCGVHASGEVTCWGSNQYGQTDTPAGRYRSVSAGGAFNCAVRDSGELVCWGLRDPAAVVPADLR